MGNGCGCCVGRHGRGRGVEGMLGEWWSRRSVVAAKGGFEPTLTDAAINTNVRLQTTEDKPIPKTRHAVSSYQDFPHVEFTVVREKFDIVRPRVQQLYRHFRRSGTHKEDVAFSLRQRLTLWRYRSILLLGEKNMRIIEPSDAPEITVLKTYKCGAFQRCLSTILPDIEFIEFDSMIVTKRIQIHGLYVRHAGKIVRRAEASIGVRSTGWQWDEEGKPRSWEDEGSYSHRYPSKRLNRTGLAGCMRNLGFDPVQYFENQGIEREVRFRSR